MHFLLLLALGSFISLIQYKMTVKSFAIGLHNLWLLNLKNWWGTRLVFVKSKIFWLLAIGGSSATLSLTFVEIAQWMEKAGFPFIFSGLFHFLGSGVMGILLFTLLAITAITALPGTITSLAGPAADALDIATFFIGDKPQNKWIRRFDTMMKKFEQGVYWLAHSFATFSYKASFTILLPIIWINKFIPEKWILLQIPGAFIILMVQLGRYTICWWPAFLAPGALLAKMNLRIGRLYILLIFFSFFFSFLVWQYDQAERWTWSLIIILYVFFFFEENDWYEFKTLVRKTWTGK